MTFLPSRAHHNQINERTIDFVIVDGLGRNAMQEFQIER
jgi:predicted Fe-Mo cluster-binding NifX family protein